MKKEKGITLISLVITIILILILSTTFSININQYVDRKLKTEFETDMQRLEEAITQYYAREKELPIRNQYENSSIWDKIEKNINDNEKYYIIDIDSLAIELNYGKDYQKIKETQEDEIISEVLDIYIINEKSHTIYNPKGIKYGGEIHYKIEQNYISIEEIPMSVEIKMENQEVEINEIVQIQVIHKAVDIKKSKWVLNTTEDTIGLDETQYTGGNFSKMNQTLEIKLNEVGKYYLHVLSVDKEGKKQETVSEQAITVKQYAKYNTPYIPNGFKYKEGTWNNGYTIIGDTESVGNEFVWVPCVTDQNQVRPEHKVATYTKILPSTTETTDKYYMYNKTNFALLPNNQEVEKEDSSVEEIRTSVEENGGFYIAKYEAGIEGATENSELTEKTSTDGSVKPLSQKEKGIWNYIIRQDAINVSKAMIDTSKTGAKSTLVSAEAWDTTLQWIVDTSGNEANINYDIDSTGKGNYTGTIATTGSNSEYSINNIYDMAGNILEWTMENCIHNQTGYSVYRGGAYGNNGTNAPAAIRDVAENELDIAIGFRVVLYK